MAKQFATDMFAQSPNNMPQLTKAQEELHYSPVIRHPMLFIFVTFDEHNSGLGRSGPEGAVLTIESGIRTRV